MAHCNRKAGEEMTQGILLDDPGFLHPDALRNCLCNRTPVTVCNQKGRAGGCERRGIYR
jgi:hypothetical protein